MKFALRFIILLAFSFCLSLQAKGLDSYHVGDVAETDVVTPVPLDVVDAAATSALQSAQATQYPSIFRYTRDITNNVTSEFSVAFFQTRTNFLADISKEFHAGTLNEANIASANFESLVTAFSLKNRNSPVTDELAGQWARGNEGSDIREKLTRTLLWIESRQICPDVLPSEIAVGKMVRLVPVTGPDEKLSFEAVQRGELVPASSLITVSNAQSIFRREFPADKQLFARALAVFIKANCLPDVPLTQLTRGTAVCQLVVSEHFDAGDAIVRRGDVINVKTRAALIALKEKLNAAAPDLSASNETAATSHSISHPLQQSAAATATAVTRAPVAPRTATSRVHLPHGGIILGLACVSVLSLTVAFWQLIRERKRLANSALTGQASASIEDVKKTAVGPQVTQAVREAVQQELASQRRELLVTQQAATGEISALVHRLDELQLPMQERLQAYEARIQALEKELALRNEENNKLLKLKIEMISRQMKTERAAATGL